jgi:hypothetical protein
VLLGCCAGALIAYGIGATVIASITKEPLPNDPAAGAGFAFTGKGATITVLLWTLAGGIVGMGIGGQIGRLISFRGPKQQPGTPMGRDGAHKTTSQPGARSLTILGKAFFGFVYEVARDAVKFGIPFALLGWLLFALFGLIGNGVHGALWVGYGAAAAGALRSLFRRLCPTPPTPSPKDLYTEKDRRVFSDIQTLIRDLPAHYAVSRWHIQNRTLSIWFFNSAFSGLVDSQEIARKVKSLKSHYATLDNCDSITIILAQRLGVPGLGVGFHRRFHFMFKDLE